MDGPSYIRVALRDLHSEENIQRITRKITFRIIIFKKIIFIFLVRESYASRFCNTRRLSYTQGDFLIVYLFVWLFFP